MRELTIYDLSVKRLEERCVVTFHVEMDRCRYMFDLIYHPGGRIWPAEGFPEEIDRSSFPRYLAQIVDSAVREEAVVLPITLHSAF